MNSILIYILATALTLTSWSSDASSDSYYINYNSNIDSIQKLDVTEEVFSNIYALNDEYVYDDIYLRYFELQKKQ